jgi:catechol 2,3-dioxygenase-like lactoylglutathione lyase family enzyme
MEVTVRLRGLAWSTEMRDLKSRRTRMRITYAIVFVSDMQRSVAFYRDVVGLPLEFESSHWSEFSTGDATLALHASELPGGHRDDPEAMPPGRCRLGLGWKIWTLFMTA